MAGSRRLKVRKSRQILLALLAALALFAAACGAGDTSDSPTASPSDETVEATVADTSAPADAVAAADESSGDVVETDSAASEAEDADLEEDMDAALEEAAEAAVEEVEAAAAANNDGPIAQVLALVADNSESQSYSFSQGMSMRMNIGGETLDIAPEEAYVFGEVENGLTHIDMDIGLFMTAAFESLGIDISEPPFDQMMGPLAEASIESWSDDTTVVIDMSGFANAIGNLDPAAGAETALFADGPVSVDLSQVDGIDASSLASEFGQGAQVTDPSEILDALRNVDAVTEAGTDQVNGVDVRIFNATLSMNDYYDALGVDVADQLGTTGMGEFDSGSDAAVAEAMLPALESLEVEMVVMVDSEDLVRRMEIAIDMGAMLDAMFNDPDVVAAMAAEEGITADQLEDQMAMLGPNGMEMTIETWQEFDNYGEAFGLLLPDAVDITGQIGELDLAS